MRLHCLRFGRTRNRWGWMYFSRSAVGTVQNGTKLLSGGSLFRARGDDHVDEEAMDAPVVGKFRVEGGSQDVFLADENRGVVALGEHLDAGADHLVLLLPMGGDFAAGVDQLEQLAPALGVLG